MNWDEFPEWVKAEVLKLLLAVKTVDNETFEHCCRVGGNSLRLARAAGLSLHDQKSFEFAGLLHDVGKARTPVSILLKPGKLTEEEYHKMQEHPFESTKMMEGLTELPFFKEVLPGVLHHHERVDGLGYPFGLKGDEIPLASRIVLIADTFDAMTQTRSYRKGLPKEIAYQELEKYSGQQFDPSLVKIFLQAHPFFEKDSQFIDLETVEQKIPKAA